MINLKDYLFDHKDLHALYRYVRSRLSMQDWIGILLLVALVAVVNQFYVIQFEAIFFTIFILAIWRWNIDSRLAIGLALVCLVIVPILMMLYNNLYLVEGDIWAERVAVWAYYFLVIGVVKQIFEYRQTEK
jgi:hypothetical protein